jgi:UDP-3-O-[3-hydroxymyristoyl] glucosamine N-acyltransferase
MIGNLMIDSKYIEKSWPETIQLWHGHPTLAAKNIMTPDQCNSESLVFVSTQAQLELALTKNPAFVISHQSLNLPKTSVTIFKTSNIPLAMSLIFPFFDQKMIRFSQEQNVHPSACVHPSAILASDVTIGPFASIGAQVTIGANTIIGASCVIENEVCIGDNSLIHPQVFIGARSMIGHHCEIHPHTVIGSDGFGYVKDKNKKNLKIPQLGRVIIGDSVEIGANVAIDRATLTETVIKSGTKIDNLCHIAHNCIIDEDGLIAAGFLVAGSTQIGKRFMTGGNSVVTDHVAISDDVTLAGRSTVTNDIKLPGAYGGYPLLPIREHLKVLASYVHISEIRKKVALILKKLNLTNGE